MQMTLNKLTERTTHYAEGFEIRGERAETK